MDVRDPPNCKNTVSTAAYLGGVSQEAQKLTREQETYAAVVARISNGLATVAYEIITTNDNRKAVITQSLCC